jgi:putative peptidoglycan lipid II flippase
VRLGFASVVVNLVAAVALMGPLAHAGLALAASIGAWVNLALLLAAARRRLGPIGGRALLASGARTPAACVPLAAWCTALAWWWPPAPSPAVDLAWLAVAIGGGGGGFYLASMLLGAPERIALLGVLSGRRRR